MNSQLKHIGARVEHHKAVVPVNALERSRKLKSLHVTQGKLKSIIKTAKKIQHQASCDIVDAQKRLEEIEREIAALNDQTNDPIITEHALLRYLERVKGIDLSSIHDEILALPEDKKVMSGSTVITVVTDPNDHFNLAQREHI